MESGVKRNEIGRRAFQTLGQQHIGVTVLSFASQLPEMVESHPPSQPRRNVSVRVRAECKIPHFLSNLYIHAHSISLMPVE